MTMKIYAQNYHRVPKHSLFLGLLSSIAPVLVESSYQPEIFNAALTDRSHFSSMEDTRSEPWQYFSNFWPQRTMSVHTTYPIPNG